MTREEFNKMNLDEIYEHIQKLESTCINLATYRFEDLNIPMCKELTLLNKKFIVPEEKVSVKNEKPEFYQDEDGNWQRKDRPKKEYKLKEKPRYSADTVIGRPNTSTGERYISKRNNKVNDSYEVKIMRDGKQKYIGTYKNIDDAIRARDTFLKICEENRDK